MRLRLHRQLALLNAGQVEQRLDHLVQAIGLRHDRRDRVLVALVEASPLSPALEQLSLPKNHRERRAQVVRGD